MNLRKLRKKKRLTMKQLGEIVGVTESAIGMYETGKRKPSYEMLLRLSEALGCTVDDIVRDNEKSPSKEDELATELQMLRDRDDLRALLHVGYHNTPEQVRKLAELMMAMNEGLDQ